MPAYTCLIVDDRYAVPSLVFEDAPDDMAIRAVVRRSLEANPHHLTVEVRRDDEVLFVERRASDGE